VCHRATAGYWIRGVLEQFVAGSDTRGRPEGHTYPRSQQAIHETPGLTVSLLTFDLFYHFRNKERKDKQPYGKENLERQQFTPVS
jgi:hypothetical protein